MAIVTIDLEKLDNDSVLYLFGNSYSQLIIAGKVATGLIPNDIKKHLDELYFQCLEEFNRRGIDIQSQMDRNSGIIDMMTDFGSDMIGHINKSEDDDE